MHEQSFSFILMGVRWNLLILVDFVQSTASHLFARARSFHRAALSALLTTVAYLLLFSFSFYPENVVNRN